MLPWHETGIYDHPEDFNLKLITWTKMDTDGYEGVCTGSWEMIAVWENADGQLLIGNDTGCDCPTPFENTRVEDLTEFESAGDLSNFVIAAWGHFTKPVVDEAYSALAGGIVFG